VLALGGRPADIPFDHARGYFRILEGDEGGPGPAGGAKEAGA
jgi:hypothetical protein